MAKTDREYLRYLGIYSRTKKDCSDCFVSFHPDNVVDNYEQD